jgi:hypothetical protein
VCSSDLIAIPLVISLIERLDYKLGNVELRDS